MLIAMVTTLKCSVNDFLNSDEFRHHFDTRNWLRYPKIGITDARVIEYSKADAQYSVNIICAGSCPFCDSGHMRNTCTNKFGMDCLIPLLKVRFPTIKKVNMIFSNDPKIDSFVQVLGGSTRPTFLMNQLYTYLFLSDIFMSNHPMVDGTHKFLTKTNDKEQQSVRQPDYNCLMTPRYFIDTYRISWIIDDFTKVFTLDGELLEGLLPIVTNKDRLWANMVVQQGPGCFFLTGEGEEFFSEKLFRNIN